MAGIVHKLREHLDSDIGQLTTEDLFSQATEEDPSEYDMDMGEEGLDAELFEEEGLFDDEEDPAGFYGEEGPESLFDPYFEDEDEEEVEHASEIREEFREYLLEKARMRQSTSEVFQQKAKEFNEGKY